MIRLRFLVKVTFVLFAVFIMTSILVSALDSTISGTINDSSGCMNTNGANFYPANITQFTVSATGTYTIDTVSGGAYLYANSYDPNQLASQVGYIDHSGGTMTVSLSTGTTYYLVTPNSQVFYSMVACETRTSTTNFSYTIVFSGSGVVDSGGSGTSTASSNNPCPVFFDERINNCDTGNWLVIYGHDYDSGRGLLITDTEGNNLLQVSPEQIAAVAECPDTNTLIASGGGVSVYRLAGSCEYQVNTPAADGKTYVVNFDELYANAGYTSHEE